MEEDVSASAANQQRNIQKNYQINNNTILNSLRSSWNLNIMKMSYRSSKYSKTTKIRYISAKFKQTKQKKNNN